MVNLKKKMCKIHLKIAAFAKRGSKILLGISFSYLGKGEDSSATFFNRVGERSKHPAKTSLSSSTNRGKRNPCQWICEEVYHLAATYYQNINF